MLNTAVSGARNYYVRVLSNAVTLNNLNFTASKTYDGTTVLNSTMVTSTNTSGATASGSIGGVNISVSNTSIYSGVFNSTHAGSGLNISNVVVATTLQVNGNIWSFNNLNTTYSGTGIGQITPANLTISARANTKTYSGSNTAANLATVSGNIAGDTLSNAALTESYNSVHVLGANGSLLNVAALTNAGISGGGYVSDYNVTYLTANGTITPANLTISARANTKTYSGSNTAANLATVSGNIAGDTLSNAALTESYNSVHVLGANGSLLNVAALTNAGISGGGYVSDYNVTYLTANGTVTPANLTISATANTKTYSGSNSAANLATVSGNVAGDTLSNTALTATYNSVHALGVNGSLLNVAALTNAGISGGGYVSDYNVTYLTANGTITPANLTISARANTKTYSGSNTAANLATVSGNIAGDTLSNAALTESYNSVHVLGANGSLLNVAALTNAGISGGGYVSDYNVTYLTANGTITPANLTISARANTKTYSGSNTAANLATVSGNIAGDTLSNAALTESYNSVHVLGANGSLLNVAALTNAGISGGGYVSDYNVTYLTANGTVTPANLTISATANTKTYSGSNSAANLATVSGNVAG